MATLNLSLQPLSAQSALGTVTLINPVELVDWVTIGADGAGTTIVPANGGRELILTGNFEPNVPYRVHVGTFGSNLDPVAWAGPNKGYDARSADGSTLIAYVPSGLTAGQVVRIYVQRRDLADDNDVILDALSVIDRDYSTSLWSMKSLFAPNRRLGPRGMSQLAAPARPGNIVLYSEAWSGGGWNLSNATISTGEEDPFGTSRGITLNENTAFSFHGIQQGWDEIIDQVYTLSVYAKAATRSLLMIGTGMGGSQVKQSFNLADGQVGNYQSAGSHKILAVDISPSTHLGASGWYRCRVTFRWLTGTFGAANFVPMVSDDGAGTNYTGLGQPSVRLAFPQLDPWCVLRMYRPTEGEVLT